MTAEIKTQCCVCGQFKTQDGSYDGEKKEIIRTGKISHGYCPECLEEALKEVNKIK